MFIIVTYLDVIITFRTSISFIYQNGIHLKNHAKYYYLAIKSVDLYGV